MSSPRASVIVPVYNTERWLPEALASIDGQASRSSLEVIIVDDGSTDGSSRIAQDYVARHPESTYVRQENAGLGAARNHGLRLATGRYLAFLDSDDLYPAGGLDHLLTLGEEHRAHVVVGDMQGLPPRPSPVWRRELVIGERVISALDEAPGLVGNPSACNKLFRRDLVVDNNALFTESTAFEDVLFTLPLMLHADRIALTPHLAYLYRTRGDGSSIMDTRSQPAKIFQHLSIVERLASELKDVTPGTRLAVDRWIAYMQLHYAWRASKSLDDEQMVEFTWRMSALFRDIPIDVSSEFIPHLVAGLRAVAIYEQDATNMRNPTFGGPLLVRAGQVYAGHPQFDHYREFLRLDKVDGGVTRITGGPQPLISGTIIVDGFSPAIGEARDDIVLEVGDTLVRRPITVVSTSHKRVGWTCAIPLDGVGHGSYRLRLVIREDGREFTIPLGAHSRGTRAVSFGGGRAAWILAGLSTPQLIVADTSAGVAAQAPLWMANAVYWRGRAAASSGRRRLRGAARRLLRRS